MHFNIATLAVSAYNAVGVWGARIAVWTIKMRITLAAELDIKKRVKNRHYYLKQAQNSIKLKDIGQMHIFCALAEFEQTAIDDFVRLYPKYELSKCIKAAITSATARQAYLG